MIVVVGMWRSRRFLVGIVIVVIVVENVVENVVVVVWISNNGLSQVLKVIACCIITCGGCGQKRIVRKVAMIRKFHLKGIEE